MYKYLLIAFILLSCNTLFAQSEVDWSSLEFKTDSISEATIYRVTTKEGSVIFGILESINKGKLQIQTKELGLQEIEIKNIASIEVKGSKSTSRPMIGGNHYMIGSSPYGLKKKELNLQNTEILLISAWYGITDRLSASLGTTLSFGGGELVVSLKAKYNYPISKKINLAVQYNKYYAGDYFDFSYASAMLGYGDVENNISIGYTTGLKINDIDIFDYSGNILSISGIKRLSRKFALLTDNFILKDTFDNENNNVLYGFGARLIGRSTSFDFGIYGATGSENEEGGLGIIWLNFVVKI